MNDQSVNQSIYHRQHDSYITGKKIDKEIREILSTLILLYRFVPSHVLYITRGCCNKHVQFACLYMICCIINDDDDDDDENTQKPTSARGGGLYRRWVRNRLQ